MCAAAARAGERLARRRDHRRRGGRRGIREHRHARVDRARRARRRGDRHRADAARDHAGASRLRLDRSRRRTAARRTAADGISASTRFVTRGSCSRSSIESTPRSCRRGVIRCSAGRRCTRRRSRAAPECRRIPIAASCGSSDARFRARRRPTCERELEAACARIAQRASELSRRRDGYFLAGAERRERRRADRWRARRRRSAIAERSGESKA